ncbi:hypothetical protein VTK73DRAFT_4550 [Phialemonium thermophilum]|uniref:C2H2-type domain-containing protein n=1 Tax=Phialemonium thermophilum TaxID=223376 RepID=A0ABR3WT81_9PEZI
MAEASASEGRAEPSSPTLVVSDIPAAANVNGFAGPASRPTAAQAGPSPSAYVRTSPSERASPVQRSHSLRWAHPATIQYQNAQPISGHLKPEPSRRLSSQPAGPVAPPPTQGLRYVIKDPPATKIPMTASPGLGTHGFASPTRDYDAADPKFVDDLARITHAIQQSIPEAVRRAVRDNWAKALLGTEFHQNFVLRLELRNSGPSIFRGIVKDFGAKLVADCKDDLVKHFRTSDVDDVAEHILSVASDDFLDKCLEKRLLTIEAKPLVRALARAERLGYEPGDVVDETERERVIPTHTSGIPSGPQSPSVRVPQGEPTPAMGYSNMGQLQCQRCFRVFSHPSAMTHHIKKSVCSRPAPSADGFRYCCPHCGQGFTQSAGLQYHRLNKVCGDFDDVPPAASQVPPPTPQDHAPVKQGDYSSQFSPANRFTFTPPSVSSKIGDPYAHLSPEQLRCMNEEMHDAELLYAAKMRDAEAIPDPEQRRSRLDGLRNSFTSKQSMIRKKYGVRLRERRTRAELEAERERMLKRSSPSSTPSKDIGRAGANGTHPASGDDGSPDAKRRRLDEHGNSGPVSSQTPATQGPLPSPAKHVVVADVEGKSSSASATQHQPSLSNPTTQMATPKEKVLEREELHHSELKSPSETRRPDGLEDAAQTQAIPQAAEGNVNGTSDTKPVVIDIDGDSDSDDDEDIPAKLPSGVSAHASLSGVRSGQHAP